MRKRARMNSGSGRRAGGRRGPCVVLAALLATTAAAGCAGGESKDSAKPPASSSKTAQAQVPPGFTRAASGAVRLAHPSAWKPAKPPKGWSFLAELTAEGEVEARIGVITDVPQIPNAKLVTESAITVVQINLGKVQRGPNQKIDVPGADEAYRVDYSYPNPQAVAGTAADAPVRGIDIGLVIGDRQAAVVRLTGLQSKLPPALVDQIVRSVAVKA
ncbi:hypothetical protein [Spirillospora sp. NPDC077959]|uniref:hypothetical protein n=2 Tax=unclassified Spirillospora TaxID=2642701 RepID=UPI0037D9343C